MLFTYLLFMSVLFEIGINSKFKGYMSIIIISFIFTTSYGMGTDWMNYQPYYENINEPIFKFEFGFQKINGLFSRAGFSYQLFSGVIIFICIFIVLNFIRKKSYNYYIGFIFIIMYSILTMSLEPLLRQFIALGVVIYSQRFIEKRNFFLYLIFIIIASLFHSSALVCLGFYFFSKLKIDIKLFLICLLLGNLILDNIEIFLKNIGNIIPLFSKYAVYIFKYGNGSIISNPLILIMKKSKFFIIALLLDYLYKKNNKRNILIYNGGLLFLMFATFVYNIPIIARFNHYFTPYYAICISNISKIIDNKKSKILSAGVAVIYGLYLLVGFVKYNYFDEVNKQRYLEYKNYFIEYFTNDDKMDYDTKMEKYGNKIIKILNNNK